jgi:glyoxylate reductase
LTLARVLVTHALPSGSLDPLTAAGHDVVHWDGVDLAAATAAADAVVCLLTDRIDATVLAAGAPRLRVVANVAVGYDNVDVAAARRLGVVVCNTPGVLDETTADLAVALMLMACRATTSAEHDLRAGRWQGWGITDHLGVDVQGAVLGIVGWGRIGQAVARRAGGFRMRVLHHARRPTGAPGYVADLDELVATVDIVSLHVPLTPETHHLIDRRRLARFRSAAVLVNTSRGPIVDEAAVAAALHRGELFAAGLDVYEHEPAVHPDLLTAPRVTLLPHIGSATIATRTAMGKMAAEAVVDVLAGRTPPNVVTD